MALYSHPDYLQSLQGSVIPTIIGVYLVERRISIAMELPHSSFWIEATEDMSDFLKRKCIAAFDRVHERGVLHGDAELRHMLISAEGDVTLIDFQLSQALRPIKEVGLEACTQDDIRLERRKVLFKLNYGDAYAYENLKRKRVFEKAERNAKRRERRLQSSEPVSDSEDDDPDDIVNPIVPSGTWMDEWLSPGLDFQSACVVVPGQDKDAVEVALKSFADRVADARKAEAGAKVSSEPQDSSANVSSTPAATASQQKRKRKESEHADENTAPPSKRVASVVASPSSSFDLEPLPVPIPSDFCSTPLVDFKSLIGMDIDEIIVHPVDREHIHIPFEGWDGKGGGVLPNELADDGIGKYLGDRRRRWIMDANAARCRKLGLPHPANNTRTTPSPQKGRGSGKRRHLGKKPLVGMGNIKRDIEDKINPMRAPMEMDRKMMKYMRRRSAGAFGSDVVKDGGEDDSDDDHPELPSGPRIMEWSDFESDSIGKGAVKLEASNGRTVGRRALVGGSSPSMVTRSGTVRGALRRPFTLEERLRQKAYESTMLALRPLAESDDEEELSTPKVLSIRRNLKRSKRPPALNTSTGIVSTSICNTITMAALATLETRPTSSVPITRVPFVAHHQRALKAPAAVDDHRVPEPTRRPAPKSRVDTPHASAPARSPVVPAAPNEMIPNIASSRSSNEHNQTARPNAPPATCGTTARVPRRRLSLQGRRHSLVTGANASNNSSPNSIRPSARPRSNSSPPNVLVSSAIHRYINLGVHSAPATPTMASFSSESKGKAVDATSGMEVRSAPSFVSQSRSIHLMDTLKKWL